MHDNHQYGFDPHDDSDYLTIANNEVYNNGNHGIIASKRCNNVKIYGNEVYDGGEEAAGIFLHRSSDSSEVYGESRQKTYWVELILSFMFVPIPLIFSLPALFEPNQLFHRR